ncbi:MAG: glycosyltransferase family 39 protein [Lachnospiraceae bacterium]|nr:glycosyltransferase family 39 protein [Lachnospiraceae bacterium]
MKGLTESGKQKACGAAFLLIGIGFLITRLFRLDCLPLGLHVDEAGMAYDAWSLANYGVDRWLKSWPVYLDNYGAGQSSLYAFICAVLFKCFGYNIWLVRLPVVVFSALTLIFGVKLSRRIFSDDIFSAVLTAGLITFCPYMVMQSRFGLDCNLMLGASTVFLYFFVTALETGRTWRYVVGGIAGGIMLYTYALSYIILPLFLLLSLLYLLVVKGLSFKKWVCMACPMAVLALPLILVQIVNLFDLEEFTIGFFTITNIKYYRASSIGRFNLSYFITALKSVFIGDNYLYESIPGICNLYALTIPLFLAGIADAFAGLVKSLKKKEISFIAFPLFWFLAVLFFEAHIKPCTYTMNSIFCAVILLSVGGVYAIKKHAGRVYPLIAAAICLIYAVCALRFTGFYFFKYTDATFKLAYFGCTFAEAVDVIENNDVLKNKRTFVSEVGIYYALSSKISPYDFDLAGDECIEWNNYWFGSLQEISDDCNYIVCGRFEEYCDELRSAGFIEEKYDNYSLFYKE